MADEVELGPRGDDEMSPEETGRNDDAMEEDEPSSQAKEEKADPKTPGGLDMEDNLEAPVKNQDLSELETETKEQTSDQYKETPNVAEDSSSDFQLDEIEIESKRSADYMPAKVKTLGEFLKSMSDFAPIIPDAVSDYYLAKAGFNTSDTRLKRLLALATQKFISDVASDAYQYSRIRSSASSSNAAAQARARATGVNIPGVASSAGGSNRPVLTMDDLSSALAEYGLNIKRPDFYR